MSYYPISRQQTGLPPPPPSPPATMNRVQKFATLFSSGLPPPPNSLPNSEQKSLLYSQLPNISNSSVCRNEYEDLDNLTLPPPPPPPVPTNISFQSLSSTSSPYQNSLKDRNNKELFTQNNFPLPPPPNELLFPTSSSAINSVPIENINYENKFANDPTYANLPNNFTGLTVQAPSSTSSSLLQSSAVNHSKLVPDDLPDHQYSNITSTNISKATSVANQKQPKSISVKDAKNIYEKVSEISAAGQAKQYQNRLPKSTQSNSIDKFRANTNVSTLNRFNNFNSNLKSNSNQPTSLLNDQSKSFAIYANLPNQSQTTSTSATSTTTVSNNPGKHSLPNIKNYLRFNRSSTNKQEEEVDHLTDLLVKSMESSVEPDFFGMCNKCGEKVVGEGSGCTAMEMVYHIQCFTCHVCNKELRGKPFYAMENNPHCEDCYMNTLEKCSVCEKPILDRILRATGKPYHPNCFTCVVCSKCLDGIPFTVDGDNKVHCIDCFHSKFAPRCSVCNNPIVPDPGKTETVRVVALERSFHVSCYKCEDCDLLLSSEIEGRGCYPLDDHILCRGCNAKRVQAITA